MLVLSRKIDQEILINGNIKISVLKIKGNVVRIGIEAPDDINIKRGELVSKDAQATHPDRECDIASSTNSDGIVADEDSGSGYCLLPLSEAVNSSKNSSTDSAVGLNRSTFAIDDRFAETLQRGRASGNGYGDLVHKNPKTA